MILVEKIVFMCLLMVIISHQTIFFTSRSILNKRNEYCGNDNQLLDVWCLVDGGISQETKEKNLENHSDSQNGGDITNGHSLSNADISNTSIDIKLREKARILVGTHATGGWWTRSFVETQGVCSVASPEMDPQIMKNDHLAVANMPDLKVKKFFK